MDKHESIRPVGDSVGRYSAIKGGSSWPGHSERNLKLISFSVLLLQCGAFASHRSQQTSRWCLENEWCCPAWSLTTAELYSGPRMAWHSASARVSEVRGKQRNARVGEETSSQLHRAARMKEEGRGGITRPRFRFSFDCKNPDKGYYSWKVSSFSKLREWALYPRELRAKRCVSDNRGKNESCTVYHAELEKIPHSADKSRRTVAFTF